jgi:hypothetical protein
MCQREDAGVGASGGGKQMTAWCRPQNNPGVEMKLSHAGEAMK